MLCCLVFSFSSNDAFAQKKRKKKKKPAKKSSAAKNVYQDLTTRYNRYFNAKLKFSEGIARLSESHKDDYSQTLPLYQFKGGDGSSVSAEMDAVIKKTSEAVQKKPNSKWIDDCYLLLGKAYFINGEYEDAATTFQYIAKNYRNNIRRSYDRKAQEQKLAAKAKARIKKEKEALKKAVQKEKDAVKAEAQKLRDAREKLRADEKKQREKDKKAREKQRAKEKKERDKAKAKYKKELAKYKKKLKKVKDKNKKLRKAKKPQLPLPEKPQPPVFEKKEPEIKKKEIKEDEKVKEEEKKEDKVVETKTPEEEKPSGPAVEKHSGVEKSYKSGGLRHKLAKHEALLWLARSYMSMDKMADAKSVLTAAKADKKFPKKLADDLYLLEAEYYALQNDRKNMPDAINTAMSYVKKKKDKARLHYILAQLQLDKQNYDGAIASFKNVLKSRPVYDMEFNARLNMLKAQMSNGDLDGDKAIAKLEKMLKDGKNTDYQDQIYFAMAEVAMQNGDAEKATEYFAAAAENSTVNNEQKAAAFLRLAEMHYQQESYLNAAAYYDSTLALLQPSYPNYDEIAERKQILSRLAMHAQTVQVQDSLQRIVKMPKAERNEFIADLIEKYEKEARLLAEEEQNFLTDNNNNNTSTSATSGGQWYFYNNALKGKGYSDFERRWGKRPLVDNWRISSKITNSSQAGGFAADSSSTNKDVLLEMAGKGSLRAEDLLKDLPMGKDALKASDNSIIEALYAMGKIYANELLNDEKAEATFADLSKRYPNNKYAAHTYYQLYLLAKKNGDTAKANQYKQVLLNEFPDSQYAKLVNDPNYASEMAAQNDQLSRYYEQTYELYKKRQFDQVLKRRTNADSLFKQNPLRPKFDLLEAFIIGEREDKTAYVAALENIVVKYPEDEVKEKAEEILAYLEDNAASAAAKSSSNDIYNYAPNEQHYFVVALDSYTQQIGKLTNNFSDFNSTNFSVEKLKVNQMLLDANNQIVLIKYFKNAEKAMFYHKAVLQNEAQVTTNLDTGYKFFVISKKNFMQFFKEKDADVYYQFFRENYK